MKIISAEFLTGAVSCEQYPDSACPELAFVGRSNVGKSSLINSILGEDRTLVSEIPGTTRDAIDSEFQYGDRDFILIVCVLPFNISE